MSYYKIQRQMKGAKATAWGWFSKYISLRDSLATTGSPEYCKCITCGKVKPITVIQAGHMIPGRTGGILFDETIVFGQCRACNEDGNGEREKYKSVMIAKHGEPWYDMKLQARKTPTQLGDMECKLIADEYRRKYKELLEGIE